MHRQSGDLSASQKKSRMKVLEHRAVAIADMEAEIEVDDIAQSVPMDQQLSGGRLVWSGTGGETRQQSDRGRSLTKACVGTALG